VHLTNHCIAETHPDFGKFEPTNEMFYTEFAAYLDGARRPPPATFFWAALGRQRHARGRARVR
jgi:hypothetical protein